MITPRFNLSQDEKTVTITIRAPYCSLRELDVSVEENIFIFFCKPYYLRLHLPGNIIENDYSKSSFNSDTGEFSFNYEKAIENEVFKDLDLITKFLSPKVEVNENGRKITVLSSEGPPEEFTDYDPDKGFGFAAQGHKNFASISAEFGDVFEIDPREIDLPTRQKKKIQYEQGKFNVDHYLADFIENDEIEEIKHVESPWKRLIAEEVSFNSKELDFLKDLSNVEYNLKEEQIAICHNSLIDILFAYCYDKRTTFFESTSESGWTISKLSSSLCWLDTFDCPKKAIISAFRRSLIYPLYRNFELSQEIFNDLKQLLHLGEKYIIKSLIDIYHIFLTGDCCYYILNNLFIKDYITYVMKWDKEKWQNTLELLDQVVITKEDLGLNLTELEEGCCLTDSIAKLDLDRTVSSEDSENDSSETDSDDYSTDSDDD